MWSQFLWTNSIVPQLYAATSHTEMSCLSSRSQTEFPGFEASLWNPGTGVRIHEIMEFHEVVFE